MYMCMLVLCYTFSFGFSMVKIKKTASFNPRNRIQGAKRACLAKKETHNRPVIYTPR